MAKTTRQTAIFGVEDWKRLYQTYREANFQSYDFETIRKTFIDYLRLHYPETFNDYIESSEFIALLDIVAFMGQSLAFRTDLNTRENYIDTAERRDSVVRLASLVSYSPKRNQAAQGLLKVFSVRTTENITDVNGVNLANLTINWADATNANWQEQFMTIINAALVNTQRIGRPANRSTILGVRTDEYTVNLVPGFLPVLSYSSTIDGVTMPFEAVNATARGKNYLYEPSPRADGQFNIVFQNDQLGFNSANTGFFFLFKQGILQNLDFNLSERISNRTVPINIEGINSKDYWLYNLNDVGEISSEWSFVENIYSSAAEQNGSVRNIFSITSRTNDQITLNFGDGVFSEIPVGIFRAYVRASNGLSYVINQEDMQGISIPIGYVSRSGQLETLTFVCGISGSVSNAHPRETIDEIKQRAPARYYTQNRMVNGEDYNNFPYTTYNSIIKSKAINRASIGTSRHLELLDNTGKYSSTNIFGSDGAIYKNNSLPTFLFTWLTINDINHSIVTQLEPSLSNNATQQFYYANFVRPDLLLLALSWHQSTTLSNETTGYFQNSVGSAQPIGSFASDNKKHITVGSLIKFVPPAGKFFDVNNRLKTGVPVKAGEKLVIWASSVAVVGNGTSQGLGNLPNGEGPVTLNNFIPTDAICSLVIPVFKTTLPTELKQSVIEQIQLRRNFGLGYDNLLGSWYLITTNNLNTNADFSMTNAKSTSGINNDASWLIQCNNDGSTFTVTTRALDYYFGSVLQTRFFFYGKEQVYDTRTGTVISDFINVLNTNHAPDSTNPLNENVRTTIIGQPVQSDGYVDDFQVLISYQDSDKDGVPDNPDFFNDLVAPIIDANHKLVFLQKTVDFDNLERYLLVSHDVINSDFETEDDIKLVLLEYAEGQIFYAYQTALFYTLEISAIGIRSLATRTDFIARTGRQNLYFQYRHNSTLTNRIDPGSSNIIDLYIVTQEYFIAYRNYIRDVTNTIPEPSRPTVDELSIIYGGLHDYKMISDNMILNSVTFKPLFGARAPTELQATIKVIRSPNIIASISEIKNLVVANIDEYFAIDKWDFGQTFYFSELAAYLHSRIGSIVSSIVLVPVNPQKSFGDLYEIRSAPNEIFVSGIDITSVEVIDSLTSANLRTASGNGVI